MKKLFTIWILVLLPSLFIQAQDSYLNTADDFTAFDVVQDQDMFSCFDVYDNRLYGNDGDSIRIFNLETEAQIAAFGIPDYGYAYPSFIKVTDSGNIIWAGFTVYDNTDDRIYRFDLSLEQWSQEATLAGNYDMEIFNSHLLVSAMGDSTENHIFLLDTSAMQQHRPIIATGGNSSGFTLDDFGNLYYGTYLFADTNYLVKWGKEDVLELLEDTAANAITLNQADTLTSFIGGGADLDVDVDGNIAFSFNNSSADKVLAKWNGQPGAAFNYDTIASSSDPYDWFTFVKAVGNILDPGETNGLFAHSFGRPVTKVNGNNHAPVLIEPFENFETLTTTETIMINLPEHFDDPDSPLDFSFAAASSHSNVADVAIVENQLHIEIVASGQTKISVEATNDGRSMTTDFYFGAYPEITGNYTASDFESLGLSANDYWNGSDESGGFTSGLLSFPNSYNPDYGSWSGWAYSTMANDTTPGYVNQYSAITASGFDTIASAGSTYGVSFASYQPVLSFTDGKAHQMKGFFVTNNTYTALAMKYGDAFSKKFGGVTGNDPDWFKLSVWGYHEELPTDTVDFYLADYRFANKSEDYIVQTWQWVNLESLGFVDSLQMALSSSDVGQWGMNTPAYFCADNFYVGQAEVGLDESPLVEADIIAYPNPASNTIILYGSEQQNLDISIFDYTGKLMNQINDAQIGQKIDIAHLTSGMYIFQLRTEHETITKRIIKK